MTPEGKVKSDLKKLFVRYGAIWHMPVQNGMGSPTLDFHVWVGPFGCMVETKAPGGKPTARQQITINIAKAAGVPAFVCDGDMTEIEGWLQKVTAWTKLLPTDEFTRTTNGSS